MKSFLLILLAAIITSNSCPIGDISGCNKLPNVTNYTLQTEHKRLMQLNVSISTTKGHAFRPEGFLPMLYTMNKMNTKTPSANGCEGFYNFTSKTIGVDTVCPWSYQCDYDPMRIPPFLFLARCESSSPMGNQGPGYCDEVYYIVSYVTTQSCDHLNDRSGEAWQLGSKLLPVACNLNSDSWVLVPQIIILILIRALFYSIIKVYAEGGLSYKFLIFF